MKHLANTVLILALIFITSCQEKAVMVTVPIVDIELPDRIYWGAAFEYKQGNMNTGEVVQINYKVAPLLTKQLCTTKLVEHSEIIRLDGGYDVRVDCIIVDVDGNIIEGI